MIEVAGNYCPDPEEICEDYISEKRDRCERFRKTVRCIGKPELKNYCIDRFELPSLGTMLRNSVAEKASGFVLKKNGP